MALKTYELKADELIFRCDPKIFDFECTKDLAPLREFIGQDRAIKAIDFGLSMDQNGYNVFVAGLTGTGKTTAVKTYIKKLLDGRKDKDQLSTPDDWCFLFNFEDADRPQIVNIPAGKGKSLRDDMDKLLENLKVELSKAFSSEEFKNEMNKTVEEGQTKQRKLLEALGEEAQQQGFLFQMTTRGPALVPVKDGKPMSEDDYYQLGEDERKQIEEKRAKLLEKMKKAFQSAQELEKDVREKLKKNEREIAEYTVSDLYMKLNEKYAGNEKITQYLERLKEYTLDNIDIFKEEEEKEKQVMGLPESFISRGRDPFIPFRVNVFVDNSESSGPPVVIEPHPTFANMFGKTERRFLFGGYMSDHTMLKAGSLQNANGGYLLINALDILTNPGVWPALKRALKTRELRMEDPYEQFGLIAPQGLRPQAMPLNVKVFIIGDNYLYQMLSRFDEDFWEVFKVKADFDYEIDRTDDNMVHFAAFISGCCEKCELHHFDPEGVARVIEHASRLVSDKNKLTSRFAVVRELVQEADYWANKDGASLVSGKHVESAINERYHRHNLPDEHIREMIREGTLMIDIKGSVIGQINGLSVYSLGDVAFGKPSRITCRTYLGRGGVINIERESQLSGPLHNKGVYILSGYMGWKYAQSTPLSLSASICFEQSYEGVDGDSASSTELYALLSSIAGIPIKQNIAVTGSVNQNGEVQAIGGVNQKIEGFFRVCQAKGLTGDQGVMIPESNRSNLMLKPEVVNAVSSGKFHIYAVRTIDEGIELLTGVKAGKRKKDGSYPKNTVNYAVDQALKGMALKLKDFYHPPEGKHDPAEGQ